ncbi:MAG: hypothetical protein AAF400_00325 [Bacteroidota bacterium]
MPSATRSAFIKWFFTMRPYSYTILIALSLVSPSYGVQGLAINQLVLQGSRLGPEEVTLELSGSEDLEDLLNSLKRRVLASVESQTSVESQRLAEITTSNHLEAYDSDKESTDQGQINTAERGVFEARRGVLRRQEYASILRQKPEVYNYSRSQGKDDTFNYANPNALPLRQSLVKDTKLIEEAFISQGPVTILCVALSDKHGNIKKFAFSNSELMPRGCRDQAEERGYAVIKARQSHAEGQLLQFLYQRQVQRHGLYTHIVAMGCSRQHCPECDLLLHLSLGGRYKDIIAAIARTEIVQVSFASASTAATDNNFEIDKKTRHEIVLGSEAVRAKRSENYYLPPILQKLIGQLTNHSTLRIAPNSRYDVSSNKRRLEAGSSRD